MGYYLEAKLLEYLLDERRPFRLVMLTAIAVGVLMERGPSRVVPSESRGVGDHDTAGDDVEGVSQGLAGRAKGEA